MLPILIFAFRFPVVQCIYLGHSIKPPPLPYLPCSGLAENTHIIFAANTPTGGKSTDYLDRETSEGKLGSAAFVRGQG